MVHVTSWNMGPSWSFGSKRVCRGPVTGGFKVREWTEGHGKERRTVSGEREMAQGWRSDVEVSELKEDSRC